MNAPPSPTALRATVPEMVRWLMAILGPLAKLVAAAFLRRPTLVRVISPLYVWLMKVERRFTAVRFDVAKRKSPAGVARADDAPARKKPRLKLPRGRGWLARELGPNGQAYRSQLEHLLGQPEMRALIDAAPGFGRVLRPVCWMLGIARDKATSATELAEVKLDVTGAPVARRQERAPRPGRVMSIGVLYPPAPKAAGIPPEVAWNFAKYR